ncbi:MULTISPECIES: TonB-dependent receptor [Methylorubrum]|uniref:TonB-dependent receptor n=1 Tax=Methylorubrum TaxID=2282523 RepID=UPI00209E9270|nr:MULTISPECIES: TonB-dependent receptor [Methylorubrum]MCP1549617.1 iron complex outermembrane receptor protein [Methylorubrum zatmanii]MCP1553769.1 iron complex outermembrane receptor protein [Methylorubrum extorquens]MCP1579919.1 iron complex outermembrane receptor protein [Methylorubrum extorquens]
MAGIALAGVSVAVMAQAAAQAGEARRPRGPTILAEAPLGGDPVRLAIPKGSLEAGLVAFTEQAGVKLVYPTELTARLETPGLAGEFAPLDALTKLLDGTGLTYRPAGASTITLVNPRYVQLGAEPAGAVALDELHVQGQAQGRATSAGLPPASGTVGQPPVPYAGGQVATGARLGALGNRSVLKTPFNVTGFTDKLIRDQQARSVADVVLNDPSVRVDVSAFSERDSYFIRGFSVTNVDTAFDGLFYLTNARRHFIEGIERVEVLKGPTSLLSGGIGRVGGTINLIPKRAYDEPLARITTTYISDAQIWTHADLGRRFGEFKEWGVRFNGAYRNGATPLDKNEIEVGVATLGLDYRGDRFRASLDLVHSNQNITAPVSIFNAVAPNITVPRAPNGRINTASSFEYNDSRYDMAAGRVEYDLLPDTTLYAAGGISRYREDSLSSFYQITGPAGQATNTLAIAPIELQGLTGEIGLRSNFQTGIVGHQFTVSAVEAVNKNFSRGYVPPRLPSFQTNIYDPVYLPSGSVANFGFPRSSRQPLFNDLSVRSVAVADTLSLGDRFLLTLGGRYQEINLKSFATRPGADFGNQLSGYTESRISPVIALVVSPFDNLSFYGNYIEALEVGPTAPNTAALDNRGQIFPPVVTTQKEIGAKYDFGTVAVTASLFEIEQPNAFAVGRLFTVNGLQRNRGVELTAFGEPVPGVRLVGGVTFFDAQLARTEGGRFDGNAAPGVPDTAFNLYGEYDLPPWLAPGLTLTGRALYTSSVFFDQANTQSVPDWTRFDAGLRYAFEGVNGKPVVMRAIVENVFDNSYWSSATRGFLAVGAPRTFIVSASVDF